MKNLSYAPIIRLNKFNNTSFKPAALKINPTATKAIIKNSQFEILKPKY